MSHIAGSGIVTYADLAEAQRVLGHDPQFDPAFPLLLDLRGVDDVPVSAAEMRSLAKASPVGIATRRAILADSAAIFGVARMYEVVRESRMATDVVRACRTIADAAEWLGVDLAET